MTLVSPAIPPALDLIGIAVFALTGALAAARMRQTMVTMVFFALITGVGGGSLRDLLIGAPVFWVYDPFVAPVCLIVALIVWFTPVRWWDGQTLEWADALGLAIYAVFGTMKALSWDVPLVAAALMGVITSCIGGIIRDVLAGQPSILMRPELYVTAAALSAGLAMIGVAIAAPPALIWIVAGAAGFILRGAAIYWSLGLPTHIGHPDHD